MTDGRMSVRMETQRETKTTQEVRETLDIILSDELGSRDYSLFSGGEAFRANFAIRIALSKLLARRAGAALQTLIVDEGFGTQDTQGRERLVQAITSIQHDFERDPGHYPHRRAKGPFPRPHRGGEDRRWVTD